MPRPIFVHETIDIIGQGQYDYMEKVNREPAQHMPDMTSLQGTFYVLGFGGGRLLPIPSCSYPEADSLVFFSLPMGIVAVAAMVHRLKDSLAQSKFYSQKSFTSMSSMIESL